MEFGLRPLGVYAYAPAGRRNAEVGIWTYSISDCGDVNFLPIPART